MIWVILWLLLSVPIALAIGAFISADHRREEAGQASEGGEPEMHERTIAG